MSGDLDQHGSLDRDNALVAGVLYGDGSDGAIIFDGGGVPMATLTGTVYKLARDIYTTTIVVAAGYTVDANGCRLYARQSISNSGTIHANGAPGVGSAAGAAGNNTVGSSLVPAGDAGGAGGLAAGTDIYTQTASGAPGGSGGASGANAGGRGGAYSYGNQYTLIHSAAVTAMSWTSVPFLGHGGGGGAGDGTNYGGGGGAGGGALFLIAPIITNNGAISANGGAGAAGTGGNAGGGGGGAGGVVVTLCHSYSGNVPTATGAAGGAGVGTGGAGTAGQHGSVVSIPA